MPTPASDMANFTPASGDYSVTHMLANTFGNVTGNILGSGTAADFANVVGTAFAYFNSAVLFFGTVILAFVTVFGIMNTANDGQALGRRWSTVYTPLRIAASAASLIPTTSGYSIIQLLVLQIVVWGVGIADTTYREIAVASLTKTLPNAFVKHEGDTSTVNKMAADLLQSRICAATLNSTLGRFTNGATNIRPVTTTSSTNVSATTGLSSVMTVSHDFKDTAQQPTANGEPICGQLIYEYRVPQTSAAPSNVNDPQAFIRNNGIESKQFTEMIANTMVMNISAAAFRAMDDKLLELSNQILSSQTSGVPPNNKLFQEAVYAYINVMSNGYETNIDSLNSSSPYIKEFLRQTTDKGWVFFGMWHRRLSQIQDALKDAYKVYPKTVPPNPDLIAQAVPSLDQGVLNDFVTATTLANTAIKNGPAEWEAANPGAEKPGIPALEYSGGGISDVSAWVKKWVSLSGQKFVANVVSQLEGGTNQGWKDPVLQVKNLGDTTMLMAEAMIAGKAIAVGLVSTADTTAQAVGNTAPGRIANAFLGTSKTAKNIANTVITILNEIWAVVAPSVWGLLYVGYFMSIFIPMVPYMIFTLSVVGWLIAVIESVIAAPLWAVMHMTPESNDSFIGSQTQGYLLLLSVFFRPLLTVVGLLLSMIVLRPIVDYMNMGFVGAMGTIQSDSMTGLGSIFGYMLVYAFITWSVFMLVFSLPQDASDRVLKWISAGIGGLGETQAMSRIEGGASHIAREGIRSGQQRSSANEARRERSRENALKASIDDRQRGERTDDAVGSGATRPPVK